MIYEQLTESERERINGWLIQNAKFVSGGWIVSGIVNLAWCGGWHYVVELENEPEGLRKTFSAHFIPVDPPPPYIVFSDEQMEGSGGGWLMRNAANIEYEDLIALYFEACEDGPWHECNAFLDELQRRGFTHVKITWECEDEGHLMNLEHWKVER